MNAPFSPITKSTLDQIVDREVLSTAYLFHGPIGSFIESAATYFVSRFHASPSPTSTPYPDLIHIIPEKTLKIDSIRQIQESIKYGPSQYSTLFVIISHAHLLTNEAANAFLKTLEDPPSGVCFILLTHHRAKLLSTILSRCQPLYCPLAPASHLEAYRQTLSLEIQARPTASCQNQPLLRYEFLETTRERETPHILFQDIIAATPSTRLTQILPLSKNKPEATQTLYCWLDELLSSPKRQSYISAISAILTTLERLQTHCNLRLQLESLVVSI